MESYSLMSGASLVGLEKSDLAEKERSGVRSQVVNYSPKFCWLRPRKRRYVCEVGAK
jgi:hypothetical protein